MAKRGVKKFIWVIKDFGYKESKDCSSDTFRICGCTWIIQAFSCENILVVLCKTSEAVRGPPLPSGLRRCVKYRLTVVNHLLEELSLLEEGKHWLDSRVLEWIYTSCFPLSKVEDRDGGFLVNGELKIVVEIDVLEDIGKLDVSEESHERAKPLDKIEENGGALSSELHKETSLVKESIGVNGFQVLPSQVKSVRRIFERHPCIAVEFRAKNQHLRKACMNFLLNLIETLCQSLQELSNEDLVEADVALTYLKDAGFEVDWLEKKLEEVKEKKDKEQSSLAMLQETEENLLKLKEKCSEMDALAEGRVDRHQSSTVFR